MEWAIQFGIAGGIALGLGVFAWAGVRVARAHPRRAGPHPAWQPPAAPDSAGPHRGDTIDRVIPAGVDPVRAGRAGDSPAGDSRPGDGSAADSRTGAVRDGAGRDVGDVDADGTGSARGGPTRSDRGPAVEGIEGRGPAIAYLGSNNGRPAIAEEQGAPAELGRKIVDSLRVGVVVLDAADRLALANPAARAMGLLRAGTEPGTVVAHPVLRTLAGQVRRSGVRRDVELDLPRGREGGAQDPLGVHLRAVVLGGGYVAVEAADVTESHRVTRVRRDFVANVSHELKTPIGALQLLSEALLDATDPGNTAVDPSEDVAAARRFAERIHHESVRLGRLVNETMELTRLQGAEPLPAPEPVGVDWVVAEVLDRIRTAASAKRIEVVWDGQRGLTVYGNDSQLATAVANLVENAIAYSPENTQVTITTQGDAEHVQIAVTDQGIGIARDELDRIFERFYRADQARSRATGGTGLGLAIVKHIATNHGGRVEVASTLGGGSTFTIRLPARPPYAALPQPESVEIGALVPGDDGEDGGADGAVARHAGRDAGEAGEGGTTVSPGTPAGSSPFGRHHR